MNMPIIENLQKKLTLIPLNSMAKKKPKYIDLLIGSNLRRLREIEGLSQQDFADKLGVHDKSKISGWEKAHVVLGKDWQMRICKILNIHLYEFLLEPDTPIIKDSQEKEMCSIYREARTLSPAIAEEIARYGKFKITGEIVNRKGDKSKSSPIQKKKHRAA